MKLNAITLSLFAFILTEYSCTKSSTNTINLQGKWAIVYDSAIIRSTGASNSPIDTITYKGTELDYFNFNSDSTLFIKEGTSMDTANYTKKYSLPYITQENQFFIIDTISYGQLRGVVRKFDGYYEIINHNEHELTLSYITKANLAGYNRFEIINLRK